MTAAWCHATVSAPRLHRRARVSRRGAQGGPGGTGRTGDVHCQGRPTDLASHNACNRLYISLLGRSLATSRALQPALLLLLLALPPSLYSYLPHCLLSSYSSSS
eukprot:6355094-Pyramimonas_sp.AAC.1